MTMLDRHRYETTSLERRKIFPLLIAGLSGCGLSALANTTTLASLENGANGRIGLFALCTRSREVLSHRADERFLMCSTIKLPIAAAALARAGRGREALDRLITFAQGDLVEPHPVTGAHLAEGRLSIMQLCQAAVQESDSTAANLLLTSLGGPPALADYLRGLGDEVTRSDRLEPELNRRLGELDTTTPRAMARTLQRMLAGPGLAPQFKASLKLWMHDDLRGVRRLRAGLPTGWSGASKPGTSATCTNDVAILRAPNGQEFWVAAYCETQPRPLNEREWVLKEVGRHVVDWASRLT